MRVEIYGIPLTAGKKQHKFIMIKVLPCDSAFSKKKKRPVLRLFLKKKSEVIIQDHCIA